MAKLRVFNGYPVARPEEARRALSTQGRTALEPCRGCEAGTQVITSDDFHRLGQVMARVRRKAAP